MGPFEFIDFDDDFAEKCFCGDVEVCEQCYDFKNKTCKLKKYEERRCTCGSSACKSPKHSTWCDLFEE